MTSLYRPQIISEGDRDKLGGVRDKSVQSPKIAAPK